MNEELDCNQQQWIEVMERALRKGEDGMGEKERGQDPACQGKTSRPKWRSEGPSR